MRARGGVDRGRVKPAPFDYVRLTTPRLHAHYLCSAIPAGYKADAAAFARRSNSS